MVVVVQSMYPQFVTFRDSTLNTANLCPAVSVVGLFYLLTVMYTFVWFGTLVHFRLENSRMSGKFGQMYY